MNVQSSPIILVLLKSSKDTQGALPVNTLSSQASCGQNLLDMGQPVGSLQLAQPAVHIMRLIITGLHKLDETFLQNIVPIAEKNMNTWSWFQQSQTSCPSSLVLLSITKRPMQEEGEQRERQG